MTKHWHMRITQNIFTPFTYVYQCHCNKTELYYQATQIVPESMYHFEPKLYKGKTKDMHKQDDTQDSVLSRMGFLNNLMINTFNISVVVLLVFIIYV